MWVGSRTSITRQRPGAGQGDAAPRRSGQAPWPYTRDIGSKVYYSLLLPSRGLFLISCPVLRIHHTTARYTSLYTGAGTGMTGNRDWWIPLSEGGGHGLFHDT